MEDVFAMLGLDYGPIVLRVILTIAVLAGALALRFVATRAIRRRFGTSGEGGGGGISEAGRDERYSAYWLRKMTGYIVIALAVLLVFLIWTEFGRRAGFVAGLFSAGVAFALQNVLASFAAWVGIIAGRVFKVGDRVMMGGVRGDVIDLSPLKTTIMEMGSPGSSEDSDVWVMARQYTGRVVTVSNKTFFDDPVFNYSRDFEYIWEEITLPLSYKTDWQLGRRILLEEVENRTAAFREESREALREMARRYLVHHSELEAQSFMRLTDNWIEVTVRFVIPVRSARRIKSDISEAILTRFTDKNINIASATHEIVGLPTIKIEHQPSE